MSLELLLYLPKCPGNIFFALKLISAKMNFTLRHFKHIETDEF